MLPLSNIDAVRRSRTYQLLGSFWNSVFQDRAKARGLLDLDFRTSLLSDFRASVNNSAGNSDLGSQISFIEMEFNPADVFPAGMLVYNDADRTVYYGTAYDGPAVFDSFRIQYFALPLTRFVPTRIQTTGRVLVQGVDFFLQANNWIFFREDPRLLFPKSIISIIEGWDKNYTSNLSYLTRIQAPGNDDLIVQWLRNLQTIKNFKLAVAAVGRLGIIRSGGILQSMVTTAARETIYTFPDESVRVTYTHTPLVVGQAYPANTIIGNVIQMYQPQDWPTAWWRQVDWKGGFLLDPILPGFHNLPLLDADTVAYTAGQDAGSINGSKVHARIALTNDFAQEQLYWDFVQARETTIGIYLNRVLGLTEEPVSLDPAASDTFAKMIANWQVAETFNAERGLPSEQPDLQVLPTAKRVNAMDVFFQAYLGQTAFVITLDMSQLLYVSDVLTFIRREAPAGVVAIIFGYLSSSPTDQVDLSNDLNGQESVVVQPVTLVPVTDTVYLESDITEYVSLRPIDAWE